MWDPTPEPDPDDEQGRYAMARLLRSRDERLAADIIAVSSYEAVFVDNWDGGQYEAVLAVPPELYDQARAECGEVLDKACSDLIGAEHYRGMNITLKCTETPADWVSEILASVKPQWVPSMRADLPELEPAAT
ncbi:hypothetical protein TUM20983_34770 [Mycobacterium antarcticum]|uniref:hypothetical protein n=1 Tax=Mycolicibacterium sp. TUM20983 TaxID=3023369 RepID=UPI00238D27CF|nr:hypothetical protein [Mycolicibacterium sp. TUM20983]GLP76367.1 hypothetical protein TUM20983_34770 [Mycolicibacterium sp. TUM20983]